MNPHFEHLLHSEEQPEKIILLYKRLEETSPEIPEILEKMSEPQIRMLYRLFIGSNFLVEELIQHPSWLKENFCDEELIGIPKTLSELRQELTESLMEEVADRNYEATSRILREFKLKHIFRIAVRDLNKLGDTDLITLELSNLADVCLQAVFRLSWLKLSEELGFPHHKNPEGNWCVTQFAIIGLGKLGGQELNYSSDVDVIFVYSDEGYIFKETPEPDQEPTRHAMSNHQFFTHLAEAIIDEVSRTTREGQLYRIDLRLRPDGNGAPLVRSFESYENYYSMWGRTWERMMLIKARYVAGSSNLGAEFIEMIHPFRYPRSISEEVPEEVSQIKERIEKEVIKHGELQRNVKLGWGGIREIEFIVQIIQVIDAGKMPYLQGNQTLPLLEKLAVYGRIPVEDSRILIKAYKFYRDVEHRLQMQDNHQIHTIPQSVSGRHRLSRIMGFKTLEEFESHYHSYQKAVRNIFDKIVRRKRKRSPEEESEKLPPGFDEYWGEWKDILLNNGFKNPETAIKLLKTFVQGPGYVHLSKRTIELGWKLIPRILSLCPSEQRLKNFREQPLYSNMRTLSDPDRVLARIDSYIQNFGSRQSLYESWFSAPFTFDLLLLLFDRSEYLAEIAILTPSLISEIMEDQQLRRLKDAEDILQDLNYKINDPDQMLWIRRYHRAELLRIALRDLMGLSTFSQNQSEINALGDACLQYALKVVMKKFRLKNPPFAIIGLGKLGGKELTYGSDLDLLFVCTPRWKGSIKVQKMALMLTRLLSAKTPMGYVYKTDFRLRPDGDKGPLVNTLTRYERHYRCHAQLWEIQTLTRARVVCGDIETGFQFMDLVRGMTNFTVPRRRLAAWSADWKSIIIQMRTKIEKERTPYGKDLYAFKTGCGGLIDVEFLAQMLNMEFGWFQPNTRKALRLAASQDLLTREDAELLIENFDHLMYLEKVLRRWSYEGESTLPDTPAPLLRVAIRCGFKNTDSFLAAVGKWRNCIREVWLRVMGTAHCNSPQSE